MNSKKKGSAAEREVAHILRDYGFTDARRGLQYQSGQVEADVVGIPGIHIEVKIREKQFSAENLYAALAQSTRDAKGSERPVVIHRLNRKNWLVTMTIEDWLEIIGGKNEPKDNDTKILAKAPETGHDQRGRNAGADD